MSEAAATLIKEYLQLRELKKERKAAYDADLLRFDNALEAREAEFLRIMNERGETQIKTDFGTAFKSPQVRVGLEERGLFLQAILAKALVEIGLHSDYADQMARSSAFDFFTNAVAKEPVKAYVEAHGAPPPGVKYEAFIQCNVRKA